MHQGGHPLLPVRALKSCSRVTHPVKRTKLLVKENIIPSTGDIRLFSSGPSIPVISIAISYSEIPFGSNFVLYDLNIGVSLWIATQPPIQRGESCTGCSASQAPGSPSQRTIPSKENIIPCRGDICLFSIGPSISVVSILRIYPEIRFGYNFILSDLNIRVFL